VIVPLVAMLQRTPAPESFSVEDEAEGLFPAPAVYRVELIVFDTETKQTETRVFHSMVDGSRDYAMNVHFEPLDRERVRKTRDALNEVLGEKEELERLQDEVETLRAELDERA
jgi:hypothetical protein